MYKIEKNGAFSNSLNYLRITYQIPLSMDKPYLKKFVAIYLLTKMVCFFFTLIGPLLFLIVIIVTHSETDISEATSVTIGGTAAFLVNVLFTLKYKQWSDFFKDLEDLKKFGKPVSYQNTVNFLNRLGHISIFGSSMVTFIYGLAAWCNTKFNKEFNEHFDQISPVLVPIWLPFGANNLTAGTIIFTMQIIFTGILTSQSFLIQSFIIYESTEILICYISHLNDNFKETFEASSKAEMRRRLGFCVDYHVHLLKLGYRLSSLIKYTAGHVSLLSALVCGCVANQILTTKPIGSFIFLTAWLFAIFSYCHAGQRIKDKTISIGDALYESKWYNADNETMKDVQFILMRCQKPICYEAIPLGITDYPFYYMDTFVFENLIMYKIEKNGAFSYSLNYLKMTYQIPLSMDKSYMKKFVAIYLLSKVVSFFFTIIGPLLFLIVIIVTHSETDISEAISITLGGTAAFLVNVLFTVKYKQWSDFFKDLEDLKKFGVPASYQKTVNFLNHFGYISIFGSFMVIIIYGLTAWHNTKLIKEINEDFNQISPVLVPIWLPFGANNLIAGQSLLIQSFIIYESTEILICYINHLSDNFKRTFEASSKVEIRNRLRFCIGYHVHLLKLGDRLSSLVKYIVGHMSLLSALVCGCMANQMLTTKPIGSFTFLTAWLIAVFSYCHAGQRIKDKTMSIGDALYESKWYNADNETMKDVQFILMRCRKSICYEAIPLGITDYPFYFMMIKTGYSYFTLLNQST